jgi:hypothetical protein
VSTIAGTTRPPYRASSAAVSRVAGAPPRTSTVASDPGGRSTTVVPVKAPPPVLVALPTRIPGTSVIALCSPAVTIAGSYFVDIHERRIISYI